MSATVAAKRAGPAMLDNDEALVQSFRRWALAGLAILLLSVGGFAALSATAPLASAVVASGSVKVESARKKIQHPEGGVIKAIRVRDGSLVKAGDVLVELDATRAGAAHNMTTSSRYQAAVTLARLEAERDDAGSIKYVADLTRTAQTDIQLAQLMRAQEAQFLVRRASRVGELGILDQQISALRSEIQGYQSLRSAKQTQIASLQSDLKGLQELDLVGMVEKTRLRALERDVARVIGEREELGARVASAETAISEKSLRKFQVNKAFKEEVAAELKRVNSESLELTERASFTSRALELTELRSPVDGTVTELKVHTTGGVIAAGESLMEIVPKGDRLTIEARVFPADIDRVKVGQATGVKLHAFNARTTPELNGTVGHVAADATTDPRNDMAWFVVRIQIPATELERLDQNRIQPGMQADVFIRTGEKTLLDYLLQPLGDSLAKAWKER